MNIPCKKLVSVGLLFVGLVFVSGCATTNDVIRVKESGSEGTANVYPVTTEQA